MFLKRSELEKRLVSLSESKPPKNLSMGAMCYDMCMPTGTLDLICTHCKQKNVHENTFTIGRVLECERMVQAIRKAKEGIDAKLDNRAYCSKCSKDKKEVTKSLFLEVKYSGSEKTHRTEIDFDSLQAVLAFVQGKDRIANDTGQETALRDKVKIIRTALGLEEKGE